MLRPRENKHVIWHCQNPHCHSRVRGRPRILFDGELASGSSVRCHCPECKTYTVIAVDGQQRIITSVEY